MKKLTTCLLNVSLLFSTKTISIALQSARALDNNNDEMALHGSPDQRINHVTGVRIGDDPTILAFEVSKSLPRDAILSSWIQTSHYTADLNV